MEGKGTTWYDAASYTDRRRVIMFMPSALDDTRGYVFISERQTPYGIWPSLDEYADGQFTIEHARKIAAAHGCVHSDNDPAGNPAAIAAVEVDHDTGLPVDPDNDPDSYTAVTVNVTRAQGRVLRNLVEGLLTFAPDDAELRYLRAQLDRAVEGVR